MDGAQRAYREPICGREQAWERRVTSAHAAEIKGSGHRARMEQGSTTENKCAGEENERRPSGAHGVGSDGPGIGGLGRGGGGEQRARTGAGIELGKVSRVRAVGNERVSGSSVLGGVGCRRRKGEARAVSGAISGMQCGRACVGTKRARR
ncbi:hypothetical protein DFH08DRAFT_820644 [Mycena albidolilacea]|uniref:Uncharacterized protein n=1 Tax=Mycena albidolilacea TaxID=1033008 RepID=A0AAD7EE22_9AGAR|nr:hypothetical protein DFH08DRAFT_820644 [Mycena albidolilacea]